MAENIAKYLKSQRQQVPTQLVIDYSLALTQAYFIHKVPRIDIQGLKIFEIGEKYYFEDLGIRNAIRGINPLAEIQKWMENLVYMQLLKHLLAGVLSKSFLNVGVALYLKMPMHEKAILVLFCDFVGVLLQRPGGFFGTG